ncbi:MAG: DUF58 domain-containing protein [Candidatus Limnocylindrales bacterium]
MKRIPTGGWASTGIVVGAIGVILGSAPIVFIGAAIIGIRVVVDRWPKKVLGALVYDRSVGPTKTVVGEPVNVRLSLWNKSRLPVAWAVAEDTMSSALRVQGGREVSVYGPMRPFERITRHLQVVPTKRGVHEIGPVRMGVSQHFGTQNLSLEPAAIGATILSRPRMAPVMGRYAPSAPLATHRARQSLFTDPTLFAGIRPYAQGDPARAIHWRASARERQLQTKRFEPALSRQQVLILDVQTVDGPYWLLESDDELFENLCVAAGSIARDLIAHDAACGFAAAGFSHTTQLFAYLPPRADRAQIERIGDLLARLSSESSAPLNALLAWLPKKVTRGTTLTILSGRPPNSVAGIARRLMASGFPVQFGLFGRAAEHVNEARRMGFTAWVARVDSDGMIPTAVTLDA